jgi:integrase
MIFMNKIGNKTVTMPIDWNVMLGLTQRLKNDKLFTDYLLILCGCYFGLRISDLLRLQYCDVIDKDDFEVIEKKTKKYRKVTINPAVQDAIQFVAQKKMREGRYDSQNYLFANRWGNPFTVSYVNKRLHMLFRKYKVRAQNPSSHTLRKTFGRRVFESNNRSEQALIYLSMIFSHSSTAVTRQYIGITADNIKDVYIKL